MYRHSISAVLQAILAAFCITLQAPLLRAQSTELGTIAGTVTDPAGALVPGATVKVTNQGTNNVRSITTDSQGSFAARSLVPGRYKVEVSAPSFAAQVQDNIK